jgi:hypothetical protein
VHHGTRETARRPAGADFSGSKQFTEYKVELLFEIILQAFGWIFQILGEFLLQLALEAIAELFGHSLKEPFRRPGPPRPWLAAIGYLIFGAIGGGISLWLLPDLFIESGWLRIANLLVTPLLSGLLMEAIGTWRRQRDKEVIRLESFAYGFCFAFSMALVRYTFGQ